MSDRWPLVRIGDVAATNPEGTASFPGGRVVRYVDIAAVSRERGINRDAVAAFRFDEAPSRARRVVRTGDVLVSTVRPALRATALVPHDLEGEVASTGLAVLRPSRAVLPEFLHAVVRTAEFADEMVARATGSGYPAVRSSDISDFAFRLPPVSVQRRLVDLLIAVDRQSAALFRESEAARTLYQQYLGDTLTGVGPQTRLDSCISIDGRREKTDPAATYRFAGVLRSGEGLIDRGETIGSDTSYGTLYRLRRDQLVMRKLTAWEGPITVVPERFEGYVVSAEFPTFVIDATRLLPDFMRHVCRWPGLWLEMKHRLTGSVQRRQRLGPQQLLDIALALPNLEHQAHAVSILDGLHEVAAHLREESAALSAVGASLLPSLLSGDLEIPASYDDVMRELGEVAA